MESKFAVFLDRDGVINKEVNYLGDPKDFELLPKVAEAIRTLNQHNIPVILVTNQSGVARGYYGEEDVERVHKKMEEVLREKNAHIDSIYYCPHHPTEGIGELKKDCFCRKPKPGLLNKAAMEYNLDLNRCFMIGDQASDIEAGKRAGCRTILVRTGYGVETLKNIKKTPDFVASDLLQAVNWILMELENATENKLSKVRGRK